MKRKEIKENIWSSPKYYERIASIEDFSHPGYILMQKYFSDLQTILDVGCGDGSKLARLGGPQTRKYGCDISKAGIFRGKQLFPKINFLVFSGKKLPYRTGFFDGACCLFVLEHTRGPLILMREIERVSKQGGLVAFLAPNFGAPNRASPNFKGSRWLKLIVGLLKDIFTNGNSLEWNEVEPIELKFENFQSDQDTTVEPYMLDLRNQLLKNGFTIVAESSYWEKERQSPSVFQLIFRKLADLKIYPFVYWGPHLFLLARKK